MALQLAALIAAVVRALHQRRERQQIKKKHLPGVEVLESCQSVKAGSYFFVSSVCDVVSCESPLIGVKGIAVTLSK